jgi:energy-coupling factor transport system substrate-specific component
MIFMTYEFGYTDHVVKRERIFLNQMITSFATAIDARDIYTGGHSTRVAKYSKMIAERLGLTAEQIEEIEQMALLHDIGKLAIPDAILNKAGRLTPEEYEVIKTHPSKGK